jgi:hypothetical protein
VLLTFWQNTSFFNSIHIWQLYDGTIGQLRALKTTVRPIK